MSLPSVLIRKSTGEILKHAPYPNEDMSPIIGLDPDLEWLLKTEPFNTPPYDSRIFILDVDEAITTEPHPVYPNLNQYKRTYGTTKRANDEIILAIGNAEEAANKKLTDYRTNEKLFMLSMGVLVRKSEGNLPSPEEQEVLDKVKQFDVKIWKNDAEKKIKEAQVIAGEEPNIDAGWEDGTNPVI